MAHQTGESMQAVLSKAVETYRRKRFFEEVNRGYARLRRNPKEQTLFKKELADWDATLMDGLDTKEKWPSKK
jgi:hypothetical protein